MTEKVSAKVFLCLAIGVWACSTAVIWIRLSPTPPAMLSGIRLLLSVAFLFFFFLRAWNKADPEERRAALQFTWMPGLALAAHFISWAYGARMTEAANGTLIVNMVPLAMPFLLWFTQREKVLRWEWIGTGVALSGILLLFGPRFQPGAGSVVGELVCFASMLLFAFYLALGRLNRRFSNFWLYLVPVYAWAGIFSLLVSLLTGETSHSNWFPSGSHWIWLVLLAVVPTIFGHGMLNYALRFLGGQVVSVANQGQFIFAAPTAFFLFHEVPGGLFYPAAALVVLGCWITARSRPQIKN